MGALSLECGFVAVQTQNAAVMDWADGTRYLNFHN